MVRLLLLLALATSASGQLSGLEKKVVGNWRYDVKTLKVNLLPEVKKQIQKDPQAPARIAKMKESLANLLKPLTVQFSANHRVTVKAPDVQKSVGGKWSMQGLAIKVVMDNPGQTVPAMKLTANGKRISAFFRQPGFGSGAVELVRK